MINMATSTTLFFSQVFMWNIGVCTNFNEENSTEKHIFLISWTVFHHYTVTFLNPAHSLEMNNNYLIDLIVR